MRYPAFLPDNGRIGFIAPSFGATMQPYKDRFFNAVKTFEEMGYTVVEGPNCHRCDGIGKSTTAKRCGHEINTFFCEDKSDVIISTGGGETMCEDLPFVDFHRISQSTPKWFMGYSDNTNLTFTLPTLTDTAAIYSSCSADFGMRQWHPSIVDSFNLLRGKQLEFSNYDYWEADEDPEELDPLCGFNTTEPFEMKLYNAEESSFTGRLLGGCLDCLVGLCGTRFDKVGSFNHRYKDDGIIWFIESCDLSALGVRRALWQLEQAGWFNTAKGFLFGRPGILDQSCMGMDRFDAITGVLAHHNVPIVMDLDIGHHSPIMPIISGAVGSVTAKDNTFHIKYSLR